MPAVVHGDGRIVPSPARRTLIVSTLLALAVCGVARASDSWQVTTWTTDDALPQGVVYAIRQTRDGYLWFTTLGGLVRFDGVEFAVFAKPATPGLRSSRFTTLLETADGVLWAGTEDGNVTRYRNGAFTSYSIDGTLAPVLSLDAYRASTPWAFTRNGLFVFDGTRFVRSGASSSTRAFAYRTGPSAVDHDGVTVLSPGRPPILLPFDGLLSPATRRTVTADEHSLWIVDPERGIFRYRDGKLGKVDNPFVLEAIRSDPGRVSAFTQTKDGAYWFASSTRGIARIEGSAVSSTIEWITLADGLCSLAISRIYEDREGTIWATSLGNGVSAIHRRIVKTYGLAEGLNPPIAYPILPRGNDLLVGSWGGGLYRFDGRRFAQMPTSIGWVMSLATDGRSLWVSTHGEGLARITNEVVRRFDQRDGLPSLAVRAIYRTRAGHLWFGTDQGLATLVEGDRFVTYRAPAPEQNFIQIIAEDRDGALLLGTRGGVLRFRDGRFSIVANEKSGLTSGSVRAIHVDSDGTIWIGTYDGGLNRLRNGKVTAITTRQGLFDNGVFAIVEDAGVFWMSSNRGIHRASRRELNAVADGEIPTISSLALTRRDGLLSAECNGGVQPVAARTADGRIWFPTQQGIVAIDPRIVRASAPPSSIHVTGVSIDGEPVSPFAPILVPPGSRRLEIRFVAPTTTDPRLIRYRYKLEGFDPDWNGVAGERVATYTRIPPGRYRFVVSASGVDGRWNEHPATVALRALPPFWRTWWFITATAMVACGLLWMIYRLRMRQIEREQVAQAEFSRQLLVQQEEERKRVAGELHDGLGQNLLIIKNRALLGIDEEKTGAAREQLAEISATASSAIDEVRRIAHNLRPVELDHFGFTLSLDVLMQRMSSSSTILFSSDLDPVDGMLSRESEVHIFRIVQEWLSNVARHSQASACVVSLKREEERLRLRIQDDGAGFSRARGGQEGRQGIGLRSIAERVQMLGGSHDIRSTPGEGTSMTITLPLPETG